MPVSDDDIRQVTDAVWLATTGLPVSLHSSPHDDGRRMTGCVLISGAWHGAVTLEVAEQLARRAAAAMFGIPEAELSEGDVSDALGELTNMTGGNIKTLIEGDCQLSIPAVTQGRDYTVSVPHSKVVTEVPFTCNGLPLLVTVRERQVG